MKHIYEVRLDNRDGSFSGITLVAEKLSDVLKQTAERKSFQLDEQDTVNFSVKRVQL